MLHVEKLASRGGRWSGVGRAARAVCLFALALRAATSLFWSKKALPGVILLMHASLFRACDFVLGIRGKDIDTDGRGRDATRHKTLKRQIDIVVVQRYTHISHLTPLADTTTEHHIDIQPRLNHTR